MSTILIQAKKVLNEIKNKGEGEGERHFNQMRSFSSIFLQILNEGEKKKFLLDLLKQPYPRRRIQKYWKTWKECVEKVINSEDEDTLKKIFGYLKWLTKVEAEKAKKKEGKDENTQPPRMRRFSKK